jgi:large subunit ribosomal protein L7/L12
MDPRTQTYVIYALLLVLGFVLGRVTARQRPKSEWRPNPPAYPPSPPRTYAPADAALEQTVLDMLRQRRKIEAIKLYRERTGEGLKDAKDAVEAIESRYR